MVYKIIAILLISVVLLGSIAFAEEQTREKMDKFIFGIANLLLFTLIF